MAHAYEGRVILDARVDPPRRGTVRRVQDGPCGHKACDGHPFMVWWIDSSIADHPVGMCTARLVDDGVTLSIVGERDQPRPVVAQARCSRCGGERPATAPTRDTSTRFCQRAPAEETRCAACVRTEIGLAYLRQLPHPRQGGWWNLAEAERGLITTCRRVMGDHAAHLSERQVAWLGDLARGRRRA